MEFNRLRRHGRDSVAVWLAVAAAILASFAAFTQVPVRPAPAFSGKQLTTPPMDGWVTNGGTVYNQRYSPLTQINRGNVASLKPAWRVSLNGSGSASKYSGQGQPLGLSGRHLHGDGRRRRLRHRRG